MIFLYVYSVLNETDELVAFPFSEMSFFMQTMSCAKTNISVKKGGTTILSSLV